MHRKVSKFPMKTSTPIKAADFDNDNRARLNGIIRKTARDNKLKETPEGLVRVKCKLTGAIEFVDITTIDPAIEKISNLSLANDLSDDELDMPEPDQKEFGDEDDEIHKAKTLLEKYFDEKLVRKFRESSGWVPLSFLRSYGELRSLGKSDGDVEILKQAISRSKVLELNHNENMVRRLKPLPGFDDAFSACTIVQIYEEENVSRPRILDVFKYFGQVKGIFVLKYGFCVRCCFEDAPEQTKTSVENFLANNHATLDKTLWTALAFVEFGNHREADTALQVMNSMISKSANPRFILPMKARRFNEFSDHHHSFKKCPGDSHDSDIGKYSRPYNQDRSLDHSNCSNNQNSSRQNLLTTFLTSPEKPEEKQRFASRRETLTAARESMMSELGAIAEDQRQKLRLLSESPPKRKFWIPCPKCELVAEEKAEPSTTSFTLKLFEKSSKQPEKVDQAGEDQASENIASKDLSLLDDSAQTSGYLTDVSSPGDESSASIAKTEDTIIDESLPVV